MAQGSAGRGRPKGVLNRTTAEIKAWALQHSPKARKRLLELLESQDEKIALAACNTIFDRAYGKPTQTVEAGPELSKLILAWGDPS